MVGIFCICIRLVELGDNNRFYGSFMVTVNLHCPRCQSVQIYHNGKTPKGHDRFRCRDCHRVFQLTYCYEARKPGVKDQITEMAFKGARVRDTARTLKIGINTVIRTLRNSRHEE